MVVLDSPAGPVGVDPRQPAQDVQDEALSVLRAGPLLGPLTQGTQQLLVEVQELQHGTALDSRGCTSIQRHGWIAFYQTILN